MITKIDHTAITCKDLAASLKFYTAVLGFTEIDRLDFPEQQMHLVYIEKTGDKIELFGYDKPVEIIERKATHPAVGFTHLALLVDNLDQMAELLKQKGITFDVEPMDAKGNVRIAFFKDPDGNVIELIER